MPARPAFRSPLRIGPSAGLAALAFAFAPVAQAEDAPKPVAPVVAPAPSDDLSANYFIVQALEAWKALRSSQGGDVYDHASNVLKTSVAHDVFLAGVEARLKGLSASVEAVWQLVDRSVVTPQMVAARRGASGLPMGQYVTVYLVTPASALEAGNPVISFHFDEDGKWRLCGFQLSVPKPGQPAAKPAPPSASGAPK